MTRALVLLIVCLLAGGQRASADAAWQRSEATGVQGCQQLEVVHRGSGFLELRFSEHPQPRVGADSRTSGASVYMASDGNAWTAVVYHTTGPYGRSWEGGDSLRWSVEGRSLRLATGAEESARAVMVAAVSTVQSTAFGEGWQTRVVRCPEPMDDDGELPLLAVLLGFSALFAVVAAVHVRGCRRVRRHLATQAALASLAVCAALARADPWQIGPAWSVAAAGTACVIFVGALASAWRGRCRDRFALAMVAAVTLAWVVLIPHPVRLLGAARATTRAAAPPLWTDAAYWTTEAPHQRLEFRTGDAIWELRGGGPEAWLVVGGSVVAGQENSEYTFSQVAERRLGQMGYSVRVTNAGVSGWNVGQIHRMLIDLGDSLQLRGIVLMSVLNDAVFPIIEPAGPTWCDRLTCGWLRNFRRNYLFAPVLRFLIPSPGNLDSYRDQLTRLIDHQRSLGREIVLMDETARAHLEGTWMERLFYRRYREVLREVAAERDLEVHRVDDVVAALPSGQRFLDDVHLTETAHVAIGTKLATILSARRVAR